MRTLLLCLLSVAAPAATTVYQASLDQLTIVHGAAAPDSTVHHTAPKSLRVEPGGPFPDALVRSYAPVNLTTIGKRYELSGWARAPRTSPSATPTAPPVATGNFPLHGIHALRDVHSESLGGSREWTRLFSQIHRHPRAGRHPARCRYRRRLQGQSVVRRHQPRRSFLDRRLARA